MNQILSVELASNDNYNNYNNNNYNNNKKSSGTADIRSILKFFSICILIFGIILIGNSSYAMYKEYVLNKKVTKPTILIEDFSDTEVKIKISHDKPLQKATYKWGNKKEVDMNAGGNKKIEELVKIPNGTNKLKVYAVDVNGQEIEAEREYTILGDINIEIKNEANKIKIKVEGKEELSYMTYRWDDEEEKKVEINSMTKEESIEIPEGLHKLTVVVVDKNNNSEVREQEIKGVMKPKVDVTTDGGSNFIIKATDKEGITKIELIRNGKLDKTVDVSKMASIEKRKGIKYKYPLVDGENKLEIKVYNESGVCTTVKVKVNK